VFTVRTLGRSTQDHGSHLLPQRRQDDQEGESEEREGGEERGAGGAGRRLGTSGGGGGRGVGVLVTADAGEGLVPLLPLGAAEVTVAHVLAAVVVEAGEGGQLVEVLVLAAPLAVTAGAGGAVRFPVLRAVHHRLHAEPLVYVPPVRVSVAGQITVTVGVCLAGLLPVFDVYLGVVLPGIADVLEAGPPGAVLRAVTVVDAGGEGSLGLLQLVQTL